MTYLKDSLVYLSEADTGFSDGGMWAIQGIEYIS